MRHVILGAGPAGVTAAETLRAADPEASITLVGGEGEAPYARMALPYLLAGKIREEGLRLRTDPGHYRALGIDLVQGRARAVEPGAARVALEDGRSLPYDRLLVATGSHPTLQDMPGIHLPGVHTCWTLEDARNLLRKAGPGTRVVQMGAGFVGCIIMQGLVSLGVDLTILVRSGRMVSRMMNPPASALIRRWCQAKGVKIRVETLPEAITAGDGLLQVHLAGGEVLPADLYLCLVGVKPSMTFLEGTGVETASGILVDAAMETSVPGIFAAGDVAEAVDAITGARSVNAIQPNAVDQGRIAALNMAGRPAASRGTFPFNILDTLGLLSSSFGAWQGVPGGDSVEILDEARFRYLKLEFSGDRLVGANAVGLSDSIGALRGLIEGKVRLGPWKDRLRQNPSRLMEAYLACALKT
jgi:NADPH-dependent 2,4-dienoyl-CoA reductase/sulfur reductase-like enzyme